MNQRRRLSLRLDRARPYQDIRLELTEEEILLDLDPGWLTFVAPDRPERLLEPDRAA